MKMEDKLLQKEKVDLNDSIMKLGFSKHVNNCLYNLDILYVFQLIQMDKNNLIRLSGLGKISAQEIISKVHSHGLKFMDELSRGEKLEFINTLSESSSKKVKYIDDCLIETLGLSTRPYNALKRADIICLSQLVEYSLPELMEVKNLGTQSFNEVVETVHLLGLLFKGEGSVNKDNVIKVNKNDCLSKWVSQNVELKTEINHKLSSIIDGMNPQYVNDFLQYLNELLDGMILSIEMSIGQNGFNDQNKPKRYIK